MYSVYKITLADGKSYVGCTIKKPAHRLLTHIFQSKHGGKTPFHVGLEENNYKIKSIETLKQFKNKKEAFIFEKEAIVFCESGIDKNGYNSSSGGINFRHSKEAREKMSKSKSGKRLLSPEHYAQLSKMFSGDGNPFFGQRHTAVAKDRMSKSKLGKKYTPEKRLSHARAMGTKAFLVKDKNGVEVGRWESYSECARDLNLNHSHVRLCVLKMSQQHKGFMFEVVGG